MKYVLDACVLYPTIMREMLLAVAQRGGFVPLWSDRILEEWARAANKIGPTGEMQARGEIALVKAAWPEASVLPRPATEARLWLPDPADIHVLAAAIDGSADGIITLNAKDFPRATLSDEGLVRLDPDQMMHAVWQSRPDLVAAAAAAVLAQARSHDPKWDMRALFKKARLPRLGKALA